MFREMVAGIVVVAVGLATAPVAAGQDREPQFTVGGGAGMSDPFHGDFDFRAAGWEVAARGRPGPYLTIEGFASGWRCFSASLRAAAQQLQFHDAGDLRQLLQRADLVRSGRPRLGWDRRRSGTPRDRIGQYRLLAPVRDPGSGHTALLAGVRLVLR